MQARQEAVEIEDSPFPGRGGFLTTHRALAACTREFTRLSEELVRGVTALQSSGIEDKPVVRHSPSRCIVQLGPVAATIAWLRSTRDSVTDGELLVVVWRGAVAPTSHFAPERTLSRQQPTSAAATAVWEDVFAAEAESEDTWTWVSRKDGKRTTTSNALAEQCVAQLKAAYQQQ